VGVFVGEPRLQGDAEQELPMTMLETQKGLELPERPILQGGTEVPQEC
jgi:hypothetical protein